MNQDFGGKIALRLPRSLHRQAVRFAERDGISLNQFLVSAISAKVGAEDSFARLIDKFEKRISTTAQNVYFLQFFNNPTLFKNMPDIKIIDLPINYLERPNNVSTEIRQ